MFDQVTTLDALVTRDFEVDEDGNVAFVDRFRVPRNHLMPGWHRLYDAGHFRALALRLVLSAENRVLTDVDCEFDHQDLKQTDLFRDQHVEGLANLCPGLLRVNFSSCDKLTDRALIHLGDRCPKLQHVSFKYCDLLTDRGVWHLATHCPDLTHVDFYGCDALTQSSVDALRAHCSRLVSLRVLDE